MSEIRNEPTMNLFMGLPPPNVTGEGYDNQVVDLRGIPLGDTPSGQKIAKMFGYSEKDTMGPALTEVIDMAAKLNLSIIITKNGSVDKAINVYLNQIDPSKPELPLIKTLLVNLERQIESGKIGKVKINTGYSKDTEQDDVPDYDKLSKKNQHLIDKNRHKNEKDFDHIQINSHGVGGNPFLSGNAYTLFLKAFSDMIRILKFNKVVQGKIELVSMDMTIRMAKETGEMIKSIAEQNWLMHTIQAIASGITIAMVVGASFINFMKGPTPEGALYFNMDLVNSVASSLEKILSSSIQAASDRPIAEKEAAKELLQAIRELIRRIMEKAGEAFKSDGTDMIAQFQRTLDEMQNKIDSAKSASLRR